MPDDIYSLADQYRSDLLQLEAQAGLRLLRAYLSAWQDFEVALTTLTEQIEQARQSGHDLKPSWLYEAGRLQQLQVLIVEQMRSFAQQAEQEITSEQAEAVRLANEHAQALAIAALGETPANISITWVSANQAALSELVGHLSDGSPLRALLAEFGPSASQQAERVLIKGIVGGQNPRQIAQGLREAMGINLTRALTIARTETLRAYRQASIANYRQNSDVVDEWVWNAALSTRTCAVCWAMHGTVHPLSEVFASHPNCRCTPLPRTKSWEELGFQGIPDTRPAIQSGATLFADLGQAEQQEILGPSKFALYQAGQLQLRDLVGTGKHPRWGAYRFERSLQAIQGGV